MHTRRENATTITHETTCDPATSGRLLHHRGVAVTTCTFHGGRLQCHAKKEAAITAATTTVRAIITTIAAIEDRKSGSNEHHMKSTAVTCAKPHAISRLPGGNRSLDTA